MKLQFRYDRIYGHALYYPVNELAKLIVCTIAGRKALTSQQLKELRKSFDVDVEPMEIS